MHYPGTKRFSFVSLRNCNHPQTDGKTERLNQEIQQYLRAFCAYRQDDWADWLPIAEFALNSRVHSSTGKAPFELIYGYIPEFQVSLNPNPKVPAADEHLLLLKEAQEDARAALELTAKRMKRFYDNGVTNTPQFEIGDRVYLERKKHPKVQPTSKLAPKRDGPYEELEKVTPMNYCPKLTKRDKCHPVFHVDRIRPAKPAKVVSNRDFSEPPPIVVNEEEGWKVEKVLDSHIKNKKFVYKIKWKRYPDSNNSWEPIDNVKHATKAIADFHKKHPGAPRPIAASLFLAMNFRSINAEFDPPPPETLRKAPDWELGIDNTPVFQRKGL